MKKHLFMLMEIDPKDPPENGPFYVIENSGQPQFLLDQEGLVRSFATYLEAAAETANCQNRYLLSF